MDATVTTTTTTKAPRRERARIVWQELKSAKLWNAAFTHPARTRDETYCRYSISTEPAFMRATIDCIRYSIDPVEGRVWYVLMTRGRSAHSTRRRDFRTLEAAQRAGEQWARQRFFVLPVVTA